MIKAIQVNYIHGITKFIINNGNNNNNKIKLQDQTFPNQTISQIWSDGHDLGAQLRFASNSQSQSDPWRVSGCVINSN